MSVAKVIEISSASDVDFTDAVRKGIERTSKTVHKIKEVWVKDFKAEIENNKIVEYRVHMKVTFILDE